MIRVALPFGKTPEGRRSPYRRALNAVDVQPVENAATLAGLDGLLLPGGSDVDPAWFGAPRGPKTGDADRERDKLETALLREALDRDLPVLAICRGLQLLNVAQGARCCRTSKDIGVRTSRKSTPSRSRATAS
jgi:putative glutamine amidotransferase